MGTERLLRMAKGLGLILLAAAFIWLVAINFGCTTTETVYERVPVPEPYWDPPATIARPPLRPNLQAGDISREEAEADPREAFRVLGQDLDAALAWGEHLLHLYLELIKLVEFEPVEPPPTDEPSPGG